ncbi:MAG: sigma-70 family RNA polymerase sigma factor [Verrucomicrobiae bacterium]|nr:sigma-70 family RNA polymerase sigma factor [Verrucomicrobiae bacterium]
MSEEPSNDTDNRDSDRELLTKFARSEDEDAFRRLVQRHLGFVFHCAMRRLDDQQASEEVAQNVFAILSRKANKLSEHPALVAWLHRTTVYEAAKAARKEHAHKMKLKSFNEQVDPDRRDDERAWREIAPSLDAALQSLSEINRRVVLLHFIEGLPYSEIGQTLGTTEGASRVRANRALKDLARWFQKRGLQLSAVVLGAILASRLKAPSLPEMVATVSAGAIRLAPSLAWGALMGNPIPALLNLRVAAVFVGVFAIGSLVPFTLKLPEANGGDRPLHRPLVQDYNDRLNAITAKSLELSLLRKVYLGDPSDETDQRLLNLLDKEHLLGLLNQARQLRSATNYNDGAISAVLQALAWKDPVLACDEGSKESPRILSSALRASLLSDPGTASHWLAQKLKEQAITSRKGSPTLTGSKSLVVQSAVRVLVPEYTDRALALIDWLDGDDKDRALASLGGQLILKEHEPWRSVFEKLEPRLQASDQRQFARTVLSFLSSEGARDTSAEIVETLPANERENSLIRVASSTIGKRGEFAQHAGWLLSQFETDIEKARAVEDFARGSQMYSKQARAWIQSLPDGTVKDRAYAGLATGQARSKPQTAFELVGMIVDENIRNKAQAEVNQRLVPLASPHLKTTKLPENRRNITTPVEQISTTFDVGKWGSRFTAATAKPEQSLVLLNLADALSLQSSGQLLNLIDLLEHNTAPERFRDICTHMALLALAERDPVAVLNHPMADIGLHGWMGWNGQLQNNAFHALVEDDILRAIEWLDRNSAEVYTDTLHRMCNAVAFKLARSDSHQELALQWIEQANTRYSDIDRDSMLEAAMSVMDTQDHRRAFLKLLATSKITELRIEAHQAFIRATLAVNGVSTMAREMKQIEPSLSPEEREKLIGQVVDNAARSHPEEAIEWIRANSSADHSTANLSRFIYLWAANGDYLAAAKWIEALPRSPLRDEIVKSFVAAIGPNYRELAYQWAATIDDPRTRKEAYTKANRRTGWR